MPTVQAIISTPDAERRRAFYERLFGAVQTSRFPADGRPSSSASNSATPNSDWSTRPAPTCRRRRGSS